ncbi:AlpA family phage regulatory protein [Glaciimonas sp. Gout2]|uniref:helix-turn-helix transcriptional regulator n=1 Tax=unclassified Glaciimonas TaxID=2644401 RepID=UPI002B2356B7|nr:MULTISPECIES: AlpA family phage regulatory protein [unclassified Glaciimonas]MEB0010644.1 AlpA family phage regulatory protein [Glaciimonas sp. Cout2]MEB0084689.1 AlpA family phage regulatory protein [Glaciimonas sp. Gout2]
MQSQPQIAVLLRLPAVLARIPVCRASWWKGVKSGRYPQPVKLSPRVVAWREEDINALVANGVNKSGATDTTAPNAIVITARGEL